MLVSCILVEFVTLRQDGDIFVTVALTLCDISQVAMTMGFVVPVHKSSHPLTGFFKVFKGLIREAWGVLQSFEQGFGIGIVVADGRSAKRGNDAQLLQGCEHCRSLHGRSIV